FYINNALTGITSDTFTVLITNLAMTPKTIAPYDINAIDVDNDAFKSYATLQKLFTFNTAIVTEELLNRAVVVTMIPMSGSQTRILKLTANTDYTLNGIGSLDSNEFVIPINYTINKASTIPTDIKPSEIQNDNYKNWSVVSKIFTGANFNEEMLGNINIELITIIEDQSYQMKLTPKTNFYINNALTGITSDTFPVLATNLEMTPKTIAPYTINAIDVDNDAFKSYATLQKLFAFDTAVVTQELLDKAVVITMVPMSGSQTRIVKLTANSNYEINGMGFLDSNSFIIPINYTINKTSPIPTDIKPSDVQNENFKRWSVVSKLFTGANFNESMLGNLNIELVTITAGQRYQIRLTPKTNFYINNALTAITSDTFTVLVTNITITNRVNPPIDITLPNLEDPDIIKSVTFLNKIFNLGNLSQTTINNNIDVTFSHISGSNYKVILTSKSSIDFKINNQNSHESNQFSTVIDINVTKINTLVQEISTFDTAAGTLGSLNTLRKLFTFD
ncbi:MAG: hypothetical protein ACRCW3_02795, partial [Metamycoplasmataceae bacterium]